MSNSVYQELVVKNIIGLSTITQVLVLIFERQKPLFLHNLAKNSALKRLIKGTSRGLKALQSYMNDSYHKSALYWPEPTINAYAADQS